MFLAGKKDIFFEILSKINFWSFYVIYAILRTSNQCLPGLYDSNFISKLEFSIQFGIKIIQLLKLRIQRIPILFLRLEFKIHSNFFRI